MGKPAEPGARSEGHGMTIHATLDHLTRHYPALARLPAGLLQLVRSSVSPFSAPAGHRVFDEHGPCRDVPLLTEGSVRVSRFSPDGREILLYRVGPGDLCVLTVGCVLGHATYPAAGRVESDASGYLLPGPTFVELLARDDGFRRAVFEVFSRRLAETMELVDLVTFQRLDRRLARVLLTGGASVEKTHQALADELGSVREIVSRILKGFEAEGAVRLGRGHVEIADREVLRRIAGDAEPPRHGPAR